MLCYIYRNIILTVFHIYSDVRVFYHEMDGVKPDQKTRKKNMYYYYFTY